MKLPNVPNLHVLADSAEVRRDRIKAEREQMTGWELAFLRFVQAMSGGLVSEGTSPGRTAELLRHAAAEFELLGELVPDWGERMQVAAQDIVGDSKPKPEE